VEGAKDIDVAVVGLSCVDCVAPGAPGRWNMMNPVGDVHMGGGGLGNALLSLSGLGLRVGVATRIGNDLYGDWLLRLWGSLGTDCRAVTRDPTLPTGLAFVVDHGTERTPFFAAGANRAFCREDVPAALIDGSRCLLLFFAGALPALDGQGLADLVASCRRSGTMVILDVSDSTSAEYGALRSYLPHVNLVVNAEEGRRLTGRGDAGEAARALADMYGDAPPGTFVAVTRSSGVSLVAFTPGGREEIDVLSPWFGRPVKMSVGAGDAFRAGLAAYFCREGPARPGASVNYRGACLLACATAFLYLNRGSNERPPFVWAEVEALAREAARSSGTVLE
jgi:sugar/nucleoside kinase (ribokinase family)